MVICTVITWIRHIAPLEDPKIPRNRHPGGIWDHFAPQYDPKTPQIHPKSDPRTLDLTCIWDAESGVLSGTQDLTVGSRDHDMTCHLTVGSVNAGSDVSSDVIPDVLFDRVSWNAEPDVHL